jgi:Tfp pilus assembly protein FimT
MISATGSTKTSARPLGITLVELILVMTLMLMVLAIAAPRLDGFSRSRVLTSQGEAVLAMLNTARDRSAAEAAAYRLVIEEDGSQCRLYRQQGGAFEPLPDRPDGRLVLPGDIRVSIEGADEGQQFVEFRPTGECTPARLELADRRGGAVTISARTPLETFRLLEGGEETID